ncbi:hypothetical protein B0J17DRAFT_633875 [Rhizoctonia solani]|nr:hypothetical protein B0J17DRAFT_633875 [Rhizoctonia solani]
MANSHTFCALTGPIALVSMRGRTSQFGYYNQAREQDIFPSPQSPSIHFPETPLAFSLSPGVLDNLRSQHLAGQTPSAFPLKLIHQGNRTPSRSLSTTSEPMEARIRLVDAVLECEQILGGLSHERSEKALNKVYLAVGSRVLNPPWVSCHTLAVRRNFGPSPPPECAVLVDFGFSFTHVSPALNSTPDPPASMQLPSVRRLDVGGKLLTNHLGGLKLRPPETQGDKSIPRGSPGILRLRGVAWRKIGLVRGNTLFDGFEQRLFDELRAVAPDEYEVYPHPVRATRRIALTHICILATSSSVSQ